LTQVKNNLLNSLPSGENAADLETLFNDYNF